MLSLVCFMCLNASCRQRANFSSLRLLKAAKIQLNSEHNVQEELVGENHKSKICDTYLSLAADVLSSGVAKGKMK